MWVCERAGSQPDNKTILSCFCCAGEVEGRVLKYMKRCIESNSLTLEILHRIEDKVTEELSIDSFRDLGHGSFLEFLTATPRIKTVSARNEINNNICNAHKCIPIIVTFTREISVDSYWRRVEAWHWVASSTAVVERPTRCTTPHSITC